MLEYTLNNFTLISQFGIFANFFAHQYVCAFKNVTDSICNLNTCKQSRTLGRYKYLRFNPYIKVAGCISIYFYRRISLKAESISFSFTVYSFLQILGKFISILEKPLLEKITPLFLLKCGFPLPLGAQQLVGRLTYKTIFHPSSLGRTGQHGKLKPKNP